MSASGPLQGLRVVEFAGIGPAPFATMLLADMGAEVLRIERTGGGDWPDIPIISRGRASLLLDLKDEVDVATCQSAIAHADIVIEGFRPGVMERLGLGPAEALETNPRLIYGRITGWGQEGPLARTAGHDINYIALAGALSLLGAPDCAPSPPLNWLGDYAGGSLYLVLGILAALYERSSSGRGQVIDAAIVDGVASLLAPILGMVSAGVLDIDRKRNMLGGVIAPHYKSYVCSDNRYVAVGPLEPRFRAELCAKLGLSVDALDHADDPVLAEPLSIRLASIFETQPRDYWATLFEGSDACLTPVLTPAEAASHPQMSGRDAFIDRHGEIQPGSAPRFSRTPGRVAEETRTGAECLAEWCS